MTHLDTSFLIHALVPGSAAEAKLLMWLSAGEDFTMSTIAWSEFLSGPLTPQDEMLAQLLLSTPEPFVAMDARKAAELFNATGRVPALSRTVKSPPWPCAAASNSPRETRRTL